MSNERWNERTTVLSVKCAMCGKTYAVYVTPEDYEEFTSPNRRNIQDIFPYLNADERELLISHTCSKCWDEMFGEEEEFEDGYATSEDLKDYTDANSGLLS